MSRFTRMLAFAAALVLVPLAAALPASASQSRPAAKSCNSGPVFFGLHGMGEGPDSAHRGQPPSYLTQSSEMLDFDYQQNQVSGKVLFVPIYYTLVTGDWGSLKAIPKAVSIGVTALNHAVTSYLSDGCRPRTHHIALVGYSMGAWIINLWLMGHKDLWPQIRAVALFGDPCYHSGISNGIVRRSPLWGTCMPKGTYPYPGSFSSKFWHHHRHPAARTYTEPQDPVTGDGWGLDPAIAQLVAASRCVQNNCSHLDYAPNMGTSNGGGAEATAAQAPFISAGVGFVVRKTT